MTQSKLRVREKWSDYNYATNKGIGMVAPWPFHFFFGKTFRNAMVLSIVSHARPNQPQHGLLWIGWLWFARLKVLLSMLGVWSVSKI